MKIKLSTILRRLESITTEFSIIHEKISGILVRVQKLEDYFEDPSLLGKLFAKLGGSTPSEKKARASRENGKRGGRPIKRRV